MTALRNPLVVNQTDTQTITGAGTTLATPLPIPAANKNCEAYTRLLTANLADYSYSANQAGRSIEQTFVNSYGSGVFNWTINAQTGETFAGPDLASVSVISLANGESRTFTNITTTGNTTGWTASGASSAAVNGSYIPVTGANATLNGATQYTNGTYFLGYTGTAWLIDTLVNNAAVPTCSSPTSGATATSVPPSGWSGSASCTTPPIFAIITAYNVVGAGTTAANGSYIPVSGANATYNGATQYTNGTYFISFVTAPGPSYSWFIASIVNPIYTSGQLYSVSSTAGGTSSVPLTGWAVGTTGTAPAPTLTSGGTTTTFAWVEL